MCLHCNYVCRMLPPTHLSHGARSSFGRTKAGRRLARRYPLRIYTIGMKTAVSIPDEVFEDAERLAKRLKKSRSEVYSLALSEYVARHGTNHVTESMDRAMDGIGVELDSFVPAASRHRLEETEW